MLTRVHESGFPVCKLQQIIFCVYISRTNLLTIVFAIPWANISTYVVFSDHDDGALV